MPPLSAWLLIVTLALADDAPIDAYQQPFAEVLQVALEGYSRGDHAEAKRLLESLRQRVALDAAVDPELAAEALIYLGEIRYGEGDYEAASAAFREVLARNPEQPVNPYRHPPEVVGLYELVRQSVLRDREAAALRAVKPYPLWGYAPFGLPQFATDRPRRAAVYGVLQAGFGLASLASYAHLRYTNNPDRVDPDDAAAHVQGLQRERFFVQWPVTLGFYATWALSVADGRRTHARQE
jgi:hypothetical protein